MPALVAAAPKLTPKPRPLGATVAELLAVARQTSPEVAAAALDAEAAAARITIAGALPDPVASIQNDNFARHSTSGQGTTLTYKVMQEFPLWGKRQLKEDIAELDAKAAGYRRRSAELELETRIKSVFAARNATFVALRLNKEILTTVDAALTTARDRFAQNAATQEDVTKLEIEAADLEAETVRLHAQTVKTAAQLNALLSRRPDAPLAVPAGFRRLPPDTSMTMSALVDRAVRANSDIAEGEAKASSAATSFELANRNRYPDISLGASVSQENGRYGSSAIMGEFRIPLQWGAKEAGVRAAAADQAAAEARLRALKQRLGGEVAGMVAEYKSNAKALVIMRQHHLPDAQLALKSALGILPTPSGSLADVFAASQRLQRIQLDILKLDTEQQVAVAEIEKIIGGDL
ncbi:Outer membrane protein TolC [Rhizobiales bacterium GAS191]|nr:Outer membrane protein TolC [Rhizobiales bacterium GAS191]